MSKLEVTILDQRARLESAKTESVGLLSEVEGEILAVATPELTLALIRRTPVPERETRTSRAQQRAFMYENSITNRSSKGIRIAHGLERINFLKPNQGYVGGLILDHDDIIIHGDSMSYGVVGDEDPIQEAIGETFYPPMMWVKALRGELYKKRPESAEKLSVAEYLSKLGLSLGVNVTEYGDLVGSTGFMPAERLQGEWGGQLVREHIVSEEIEALRLSGLCDQAVVEPDVLKETTEFATRILELGGALN